MHVLFSDANLVDRSLIVCEPQSSSVLILDCRSKSNRTAVRNGYLEAHLKEGSRLTILEIQRFSDTVEQTITKTATIGKDAQLHHVIISLGSGKTTASTAFHVTGDNGSVTHRQIILASGTQDHCIKTDVFHCAPRGRSEIATKTVAENRSVVVSHGNVRIFPLAQQTHSHLCDHALILDPRAKAESIPGMEIEANDVQAGHSASTSQLNSEHLFYLQSRGLDEREAKKSIILGFLESNAGEANRYMDVNALIEDRWNLLHQNSLCTGIRRQEFPILKQRIHGKPLSYLDNAATTQKPAAVLSAINSYYEHDNANIHRGLHALSERATQLYEGARQTVARFINAKPNEIIFVRNATEGINLLAQTLGQAKVGPGDRILLTKMEHHSNIVPWQLLCREKKAVIDAVDITPEGILDPDSLKENLAKNPIILAVCHVSNVLGTVHPIKSIVAQAHQTGTLAVVDGAQSVPHFPVDVKDLDCDAMVFSGHKMLGPTGIGVVYIKQELMAELEPYMGGGGMIKEVWLNKISTFKDGPERFEAGTPHIAGALGLAAAIDYLSSIGMDRIKAHTDSLVHYALESMRAIPQITVYGPSEISKRAAVIAFNLGDIHAHDVSTVLDEEGIAVRAGHHCAMPLMERMGLASTCRASFYLYNSTADVDQLIAGLRKAVTVFRL